jgi:predicted metal-dependent HD superfamily phosphohydrolase
MSLAARWTGLWTSLDLAVPHAARAEFILARYAEPHRAYHTLQHLRECLDWFDRVCDLAHHPLLLEVAVWYHDAIYDPRRNDNEDASASLAREHLSTAGAPSDHAEYVASLIRWTTHAHPPPPGDPTLLVDIDLAILGADTVRYAEYERQIRQEYAWVPSPMFRRRRANLLSALLARPRLFQTPRLHDQLERRARDNVARAIGLLRGA